MGVEERMIEDQTMERGDGDNGKKNSNDHAARKRAQESEGRRGIFK